MSIYHTFHNQLWKCKYVCTLYIVKWCMSCPCSKTGHLELHFFKFFYTNSRPGLMSFKKNLNLSWWICWTEISSLLNRVIINLFLILIFLGWKVGENLLFYIHLMISSIELYKLDSELEEREANEFELVRVVFSVNKSLRAKRRNSENNKFKCHRWIMSWISYNFLYFNFKTNFTVSVKFSWLQS